MHLKVKVPVKITPVKRHLQDSTNPHYLRRLKAVYQPVATHISSLGIDTALNRLTVYESLWGNIPFRTQLDG